MGGELRPQQVSVHHGGWSKGTSGCWLVWSTEGRGLVLGARGWLPPGVTPSTDYSVPRTSAGQLLVWQLSASSPPSRARGPTVVQTEGLGSSATSGPSCLCHLEEAPRLCLPFCEAGTLGPRHIPPGVGARLLFRMGPHSEGLCQLATETGNWSDPCPSWRGDAPLFGSQQVRLAASPLLTPGSSTLPQACTLGWGCPGLQQQCVPSCTPLCPPHRASRPGHFSRASPELGPT